MKTLKLIALSIVAIIFASCKASQPTGPINSGMGTSMVVDVNAILDTTSKTFISYAQQTNGNPSQAMMLTAAWLQTQPNVSAAICDDSVYINIFLASGLESVFYFEDVDANGKDIFRGGGSRHDPSPKPDNEIVSDPLSVAGMPASNTITNKNILIYASDTGSLGLTGQLQQAAQMIGSSSLGLSLTTLVNNQCTYEAIATFGSYGLVILDTHGQPDGFLVGSRLSVSTRPTSEVAMQALVTAQASADIYNQLVMGDVAMGTSVKGNVNDPQWAKKAYPDSLRTIWVTAKYLNTLPIMSGTVIFGNMCQSGNARQFPDDETPIRTAFLGKNPISYYCYVSGPPGSIKSASLSDNFARQMEDTLLTRLLINQDSTGVANLKSDNMTEFFDPYSKNDRRGVLNFRHFGSDNYSYASCIDTFTDARDGQVYKAVCIGNQTWMAQNLNYNAPGSVCSGNLSSNCNTYGKLYDWNTVMQGAMSSAAVPSGVQGVCPKGWHVPSQQEFNQLCTFLGGPSVAGGKMKDTSALWNPMYANVGATNSSGFSALPGGSNSGGFGIQAFFWSATEDSTNPLNAFDGVLYIGAPTFGVAGGDKTIAQSCRCVKDP
jgi:uncharacterized protein (TIGR02145 family)